jgi:L-amino acid N-acyltransferase YncA
MKINNDIIIRRATPDDAKRIIDLVNPIIEKDLDAVQDLPYTVEFVRSLLENSEPRFIYNVAIRINDGKVVGYARITPPIRSMPTISHNAIFSLFIDLNERRKGIGTLLAEKTLDDARKMNFENVQSYLREGNIDSITFSLKMGFGIIGTSLNQAKCYSRYINMVIMERNFDTPH